MKIEYTSLRFSKGTKKDKVWGIIVHKPAYYNRYISFWCEDGGKVYFQEIYGHNTIIRQRQASNYIPFSLEQIKQINPALGNKIEQEIMWISLKNNF